MTIRLRGDGVVLRPFTPGDFAVLWDEETKDRGPFEAPWSPHDEKAKARVRARVEHSGTWRDNRVLDLAIEVDGAIAGDIQVRRDPEYAPPGIFDLGIGLFEAWRAKGVGTTVLQLITAFLFDEEQAGRVSLSTDVDNVAMRRAAEKAGFTLEGIMRGFWSLPDGSARDHALYARTRGDHGSG